MINDSFRSIRRNDSFIGGMILLIGRAKENPKLVDYIVQLQINRTKRTIAKEFQELKTNWQLLESC